MDSGRETRREHVIKRRSSNDSAVKRNISERNGNNLSGPARRSVEIPVRVGGRDREIERRTFSMSNSSIRPRSIAGTAKCVALIGKHEPRIVGRKRIAERRGASARESQNQSDEEIVLL